MTTKIKRGGDIPVKFTVLEEGEQKNMNAATALSWRLSSVEYGCRRLPRMTVVGGDNPYTVIVHTTAETPLGLYFLTLDFEDQGARRSVDAAAFQLVEHSSACSCIDPDKAICILADTCIGQPGPAGLTPYIGDNGNWWIGGQDTGKPSQGTDGHSPVITADAAGNIYADGKLLTGVIPEAIDLLKQQEESAARAEAERAAAETKRAQEEAQREKQEQQRQTQTAQAIENANQAAGEATQAGQTAQRAAETATAAASGATQAASAASDAAAKAQTAAGEANAAASSAAQAAKEAQTAAKAAEEAGVRADTATASATDAAASAEAAATSANQGAEAAAEAAQNAKEATDAILALPVVRTDIEQTIASEGQTIARKNISAVGGLVISLSLDSNNILLVTTSYENLTDAYDLYSVHPDFYRWGILIANTAGKLMEALEAEVIYTTEAFHLAFYSALLGQHYDLALVISNGHVVEATITPWRRKEQAGVKLGYGQLLAATDIIKYQSEAITIGMNNFSLEFYGNTYGSGSADSPTLFNVENPAIFRIYMETLGANGIGRIDFAPSAQNPAANDSVDVNWVAADAEYRFHSVVVRAGKTISVYINGELHIQQELSEIKDLGNIVLGLANSSNIGFLRTYDYAITEEEVKDLYNGGNPIAYVLPTALKNPLPVEVTGVNSYTWTGVDSPYNKQFFINRKLTVGRTYRLMVTVSDYQSGEPFLFISARDRATISAKNGTYEIIITLSQESPWQGIQFYAGANGTDRRLTLTLSHIEELGCKSEYLSQNITLNRWFDSARQMPNNNILPPLWGTIGGNDLVAIGNPGIIYDKQLEMTKIYQLEKRIEYLTSKLDNLTNL